MSPDPEAPTAVAAVGGAGEDSGVVEVVNFEVGAHAEDNNDEGEDSTTISRSSIASGSTQNSDVPLLGTEETNVVTMPYSPQVEVNMESLLPPISANES